MHATSDTPRTTPVPAALARFTNHLERVGVRLDRSELHRAWVDLRFEEDPNATVGRHLAALGRLRSAASDEFGVVRPTFSVYPDTNAYVSIPALNIVEEYPEVLARPAGRQLLLVDVTESVWSTFADLAGDTDFAALAVRPADLRMFAAANVTADLAGTTGMRLHPAGVEHSLKQAFFHPAKTTAVTEALHRLFPAAAAYAFELATRTEAHQPVAQENNTRINARAAQVADAGEATGLTPAAWLRPGVLVFSGLPADVEQFTATCPTSWTAKAI